MKNEKAQKISASKKPILIFIGHFVPGYKSGGPQRSILNLVHALHSEFDFYIICRDRDLGDTQPYPDLKHYTWIRHDTFSVLYYTTFQSPRLIAALRTHAPFHAVLLNSFFARSSYLGLLLTLSFRLSSRVFLAPRGELFEGPLALKAGKKQLFIRAFKTLHLERLFRWIATDESEKRAILQLFPASLRAQVASNIPFLPSIEHSLLAKPENSLRIVYLSRITPIKNLLFALEVLSRVPPGFDISLDIYGTLEDAHYWQRCLEQINLCAHVQVQYCGPLHPDTVPSTLSQYHLFWLPTLSENFGHAIFEALAAGIVTLISDQTPWHGLEQANAGWDLPLEDSALWLDKILFLARADFQTLDSMRQNARTYAEKAYAASHAVEQMRTLLNG